MSREAMGWFVKQFASDGNAQMLLHLLCWRSDETGAMPPLDLAYLARHSRQSERNVSRTLKEFEDAGVFEREITYTASGGQRIGGRLNFAAQLDIPTVSERNAMARAQGGDDDAMRGAHSENEGPEGDPGPAKLAGPDEGGSRQIVHQVSPNTAPGPAKLAGPPLYEENTSKTLKGAGADAAAREREKLAEFETRLNADWARFLKAFPFTGAMDLPAARRELGKLSLGDRDEAIAQGEVYAAEIKASARSFPKEAWKWLAERQFEALAQLRQSRAEKAGLKRPQVFVIEGTPWWDQWQAWRRANGLTSSPVTSHEGKRGWWFDSQLPPKKTGPPEAVAALGEVDFG